MCTRLFLLVLLAVHISEHDSGSELSEDRGDQNINESEISIDKSAYMYRKKWIQMVLFTGSAKRLHTRKHRIIMKVPLLKRRARELGATADTIAVWELLFTSSMLLQIVELTNHKLGRIGMKYRIATVHLRNVDVT